MDSVDLVLSLSFENKRKTGHFYSLVFIHVKSTFLSVVIKNNDIPEKKYLRTRKMSSHMIRNCIYCKESLPTFLVH